MDTETQAQVILQYISSGQTCPNWCLSLDGSYGVAEAKPRFSFFVYQ
jgi:hypothetical protein